MKPASAKAKGRRLQNAVAAAVQATFGLSEDDVRPAIMGEQGADIKLSTAAASLFPYATECKAVERLNVWEAYRQAEKHAKGTERRPLLIMTRNRAPTLAVIPFDHLLELLDRATWGE